MRKSITINIPEPCHEDWNKMTPKEKGLHCHSCHKTVFDFTTKTDEQIIKTFETEGKVCGRFKTQQLNREIVLTRKDKNNYLSWAASGLFAFLALGNQEVNAQGKPKIVQTDSVKVPQIKGKVATSILNKKVYSGTLTTTSDGLPLPGASVIIKGTSVGTQTDFDGKYKIQANIGNILVFSYMGMDPIEIVLSNSYTIDVALVENIMGEIVTVGLITYSSNYTHDCNLSEDNDPELYATEAEQQKSREIRAHNQKWRERNKARRTKWRNERLLKREAIKSGNQERTVLGKLFHRIKSAFAKK
ncbi:carboxypeptidase-like regulatory domain-containing protein [Winogradskyella sp. PG-2]|uniref:carboxypeptidase-like regulatory domain-containing protein n=1 Tax=Winogradskyella sp. PG-2 TaxID=754409 RepID=UPI0004586661|nr:carboxypeptidase-like regulatory domain-containing protein [Winogradskyella sp. PG-2]BAO77685.1 TonB-dependent receptor [Winogradskyella sp. PG-2]